MIILSHFVPFHFIIAIAIAMYLLGYTLCILLINPSGRSLAIGTFKLAPSHHTQNIPIVRAKFCASQPKRLLMPRTANAQEKDDLFAPFSRKFFFVRAAFRHADFGPRKGEHAELPNDEFILFVVP